MTHTERTEQISEHGYLTATVPDGCQLCPDCSGDGCDTCQQAGIITATDGARVCRTCGFADCPGATTGNCPRWPAREDATMRTLDQIHADAAVQVARETLNDYNTRNGQAERPHTWDLVMAARLASDAQALLNVIERMRQA